MGSAFTGGLQAAGSILQGNAQAAAGKARQEELNREAQLTRTAADQSSASRLTELHKTMGAIAALTAGRNLDTDSPSGMAFTGGVEREAKRNIRIEAFNADQQAKAMKLAGRVANMSGNAASISGYLTGTGQFIKGLDDAFAKALGGAGGGGG